MSGDIPFLRMPLERPAEGAGGADGLEVDVVDMVSDQQLVLTVLTVAVISNWC